jgi:ribosomal protein S18 acetylase RimI-like enzyme
VGASAGDRLIGIAVLDGRRIGINLDTLDMYFLHTSNGYRRRGVGEELVRLVRDRATELGARRLYVSSTPSANSVNFYQRRGFGLASEVDPELFALEPDDIHMEMPL